MEILYFLGDMFHEFTTDEIKTFWKLLQKLYCFDGKEAYSFEKDAEFDSSEIVDTLGYQERILNEFKRRRKMQRQVDRR